MNSFGRLFSITLSGESHGKAVLITIDGVPPGISISETDFTNDILRRKPGKPGTTTRIESDIPQLLTGILEGYTTGAPLTLSFENNNVHNNAYLEFQNTPRPGHADLTARQKFYNWNDIRGGGQFSGRMTIALVAAGVIAKKIISPILVSAEITELGGTPDIESGIAEALATHKSIGGIIRCIASPVPAGLGEPFFDSCESLISHLIFSIPGVKGIEFGSGFQAARMTGLQHNDPIIDTHGTTETNHAGGINGGISNGNPLVFSVAVKPTATTEHPQKTWNFSKNNIEMLSCKGRHDLCFALRTPVIIEAVTAIVLADLLLIRKSQENTYTNKSTL